MRAVYLEQENIIAAANPGQAGIIVSLFVGEHVGGLSLKRGVKLNRRKSRRRLILIILLLPIIIFLFMVGWTLFWFEELSERGASHV